MTWLRSERNVQWLQAGDPEETFAAALRLAVKAAVKAIEEST